MNRDRNLLFGVLAVQLRKITPSQLVDAAGAWATDPSRDLPDRLVEMGVLAEADRAMVVQFVEAAVSAYEGDASLALTSFGGDAAVQASFRGTLVRSDSDSETVRVAGKSIEGELSTVPGVQEPPGRYTHLGEYGRGGMGRVLLVHDDYLGREIALKELLPSLARTDASSEEGGPPSPVRMAMPVVARFLQEARITGQLEHPSIVPVYELGYRNDGTLYYTMKLVRGKTLAQAIKECTTLEERLRLLPHFVDLCQAMAYAHSRHIIHRDIKPGNVMVGEFGETVVLDWGLAKNKDRQDVHAGGLVQTIKAMNLGDESDLAKTAYGHALGTPAYMPPEQAQGDLDAIDERSDIYSLGAVLYEILTGHAPFEGDSVAHLIYQVLEEEPKGVRSLEPRAPAELAAICQRAMNKVPGNRFRSATQLAHSVASYPAQRFYLNPTRPSVEDRVPELNDVAPSERERLKRQANAAALRDWRYWATATVSFAVLLLYGVLPFALQTRTVVQLTREKDGFLELRNRVHTLEKAAGTDPAAVAALEDKTLNLRLWLLAFHKHRILVFLGLSALFASYLYLWIRFASEYMNRIVARHLRDILAGNGPEQTP